MFLPALVLLDGISPPAESSRLRDFAGNDLTIECCDVRMRLCIEANGVSNPGFLQSD